MEIENKIMNIVEMCLNYLDFSKILVMLTAILIIFVTFLLILSDSSILTDESNLNEESSHDSEENKKKCCEQSRLSYPTRRGKRY